jgi:hypothetical protein
MVISSPTRHAVSLAMATHRDGRHTDLNGGPCDAVLVAVHAINDQLAASSDVVDRVLENLDATGGLNNNIEAIWVLGLELRELWAGVLSAELDIHVGRVQRLGKVHLQAFGCGDDDMAAPILTQHLGEHETGGTGAEHENGGAHLGRDLVESVGGAGRRFEQGGIDVGQVLDVEDTAGWRSSVRFTASTTEQDTPG